MEIMANYVKPFLGGTKKFASEYSHFVFGTQNEHFSESLKTSVKKDGFNNFGKNLKDAYVSSKKTIDTSKGFWSTMWNDIKSIPKDIGKSIGEGTGFWGKTKGLFKGLGKKMPLIGNILMVAFEAPNIFKAFTEGGIGTGLVETGKAALKLGAFTVGAAIGQALIPIPFVGAMIGGIAAGWLADGVLGKSFTEKQEEAAEQQKLVQQPTGQQLNTSTNPYLNTTTVNPNSYMTGSTTSPTTMANNTSSTFNPALMSMDKSIFSGQENYMDKDFMKMQAGLA